MKIVVQKKFHSNVYKPFIGEYDAYIAYDENIVKDILERCDIIYSENMSFDKFSQLINCSWVK